MIDASGVFTVHGLLGNQVGIRASKIVTVTQGVSDSHTRIFVDNDPEPVVAQESWEVVMELWTQSVGSGFYKNEDRWVAVLGAVDDTTSDEEE